MSKEDPTATATAAASTVAIETERDRVRRAQQGEVAAFTELVKCHQDAVYGLLLRLSRDPTTAEDLAQDTFVKAYLGLGRFRVEAKFSTWLYRIAMNLFHDYGRSRSAKARKVERSLQHLAEGGFDPPSSTPRPDHRLEEKEMAKLFDESLDKLATIFREPFLLRHQENRSYEEIAEILSISVVNAKVRVHRARNAILAVLRDHGHAL